MTAIVCQLAMYYTYMCLPVLYTCLCTLYQSHIHNDIEGNRGKKAPIVLPLPSRILSALKALELPRQW